MGGKNRNHFRSFPMSYAGTTTVSTTATGVLHILERPFVAFGNLLIKIAASSSYAKAIDQLAEMSDEDLAAMGTTRAEAVQDIFRGHL
jgi:uncharacterized protein YjiS (DUF1127 family)